MERAQILQSVKEMDDKELAEALPRLREEALKAEEALRVAQERLQAADHRLARIPTFVEVHEDRLVVDRRGMDKMFRLVGRLTIPLDHVVRAEADPNIEWSVVGDFVFSTDILRGLLSTLEMTVISMVFAVVGAVVIGLVAGGA